MGTKETVRSPQEEIMSVPVIFVCWVLLAIVSLLYLMEDDTDEGIVIGMVGLAIAFFPLILIIWLVNYIHSPSR